MGFLSDIARAFVYRPDRVVAEECNVGGFKFVPVSVFTEDGVKLTGLRSISQQPINCTVVFLHGNGGSAASRAHLLAPLCGLGVDLIVADYRGFGGNSGEPHEAGLLMDANAFCELAIQTSHDSVFIVGHSLGGAVAIQTVSRSPREFRGLVTIGTFTSLSRLAPWFARPFLSDKFDSLSLVNSFDLPWLLLHETQDPVIPVTHSQNLFDAKVQKHQTKLVTLNGGSHSQLHESSYKEMTDFFDLNRTRIAGG